MDDTVKHCSTQRLFPQYVIARHAQKSYEVLCISLEAGEEALPVFSFKDLARTFLEHRDPGSGWHVKESCREELVALLLGPCANVALVLPNPLPDPLAARDALLNSTDRESFVNFLVG